MKPTPGWLWVIPLVLSSGCVAFHSVSTIRDGEFYVIAQKMGGPPMVLRCAESYGDEKACFVVLQDKDVQHMEATIVEKQGGHVDFGD